MQYGLLDEAVRHKLGCDRDADANCQIGHPNQHLLLVKRPTGNNDRRWPSALKMLIAKKRSQKPEATILEPKHLAS